MSAQAKQRLSKNILIAWILAGVVVAAIVIGVILLDSPAQERLNRLDDRRVSDWRELSFAVHVKWTREGRLPSSLEELSIEERIVRELADPVTGDAYEYRVVDEDTYELCAVFEGEIDAGEHDIPYEYLWFHGPGRQCFELKAQDINREIERY